MTVCMGPTPDEIRLELPRTLDADTAESLRPSFEALARGPVNRVVLDLSGVTEMDGSGIGAIAFLFKRLTARGGKLALNGAGGQPLAMMQDLGLTGVLGLAAKPSRTRRWFGDLAVAGGH